MADLTVITPIASSHVHLFAIAAESVARQTVQVMHFYKMDTERRGPGAIRNLLLEQVHTPYVTFLDADDWMEHEFAERAITALRTRPNRYVYTDWYQDGKHINAPDCAWVNRTFHLVTAVVPTEWVRAVGGFDESLRGMEDTDLYVKLVTRGFCGVRLPLPLLHYRKDGGRSKQIHESGEVDELQAEMTRRYGDKQVSCCGETIIDDRPVGEHLVGDVLAMALWGGNRKEFGRATGRRYPRMSYPKTAWVDPRDVAASPHLWQIAPEPEVDSGVPPRTPAIEEAKPSPKGVEALATELEKLGFVKPAPPTPLVPMTNAVLPNVAKVKRLAMQAYGNNDYPIFVMPRKAYPSYADFWRLVELGGFEAIYQDEIDLNNPSQTYIFAAPDGIPDCAGAKAHTIFWQLEYTGDYTSQRSINTVDEVWSSDPHHAKRTGARFVLLGGHRGLNPELKRYEDGQRYDITMLAYMVDRRRAIKERIEYMWSPDYPGHGTEERHQILTRTKIMLHVHQHETPALAPLRMALAAAYGMTVISEVVPDAGPYKNAVIWADYDGIPSRVSLNLKGKIEQDSIYPDALHSLLCVDNRFDRVVMNALDASSQEQRKAA